MNDVLKHGIFEHAAALDALEYSSEELTRAYLDHIGSLDTQINAFITVCEREAIAAARASDARRIRGEALGVLDGIPYAAKDNLVTLGIRTTCGSRMLKNYIPPYSATAIERLSSLGGVLLGKTNMDEFGMGSSTENSAFGVTRNPLSTDRVAGGSSGGSAAAVCADMAAFSLGSDTGGSVRQPAAFCGVIGLKPTYARISRYGLVAFASSLDCVGTLTKSARDASLLLSALSGADGRDATALSEKFCDGQGADTASRYVSGLRIGVIGELCGDGAVSNEVRNAISDAAKALGAMGAQMVEVSLPCVSLAAESYYIISSAEASSNLARFDGIRYGRRADSYADIDELYTASRSEGFGDEVKRRIMLGTFALSAGYYDEYYGRAQAIRSAIEGDLCRAFGTYDLLLCPSAPSVAWGIGQKMGRAELYASDLCNVPASLASLPAISIPYRSRPQDLPIGIQLIAPRLCEDRLIRVAEEFLRESEGRYE